MIRHIVFDMGNVLRSFDENHIIARYTQDVKEAGMIKEKLFDDLWAQLDKGTITYDEVKDKLKDQMPKDIYKKAEELLDTWHLHMPMNPEMEKLIPRLKDNGYHLYLLSNASVRFETYQKETPLFDYFDGFVVSGFHQTIKPEKRIYEILFNTYHLTPSECVFIDDNAMNTATAEELGMRSHVFDGNMEKLLLFFDDTGVSYQKE